MPGPNTIKRSTQNGGRGYPGFSFHISRRRYHLSSPQNEVDDYYSFLLFLCTAENGGSILKLAYRLITRRPCIWIGLWQSDALSLLYLVRYRRGRDLLLGSGGRCVCKICLYITEVGVYYWAAEDGEEFYQTINEITHKRSEAFGFTSLHGLECSDPSFP